MNTAGISERELRKRVAARAQDLGAALRPGDVMLSYGEVPTTPGYRLFHASWGAGVSADALSGLVHAGEEPDLLPGHAIETLMEVWRTAPTPAAGQVAQALAFLLDPMARWEPLLTDDDVAAWGSGEGPVTAPALETDDASGCITRTSFWWRRGSEAQVVVVDVDASGHVTVGGGRSSDRSAIPEAEGERP
ncbi:hypothetical protein LR392_04880 [Arthrobacter sp. AK04]|uniref:hypothetical protein n=1 Tax=Arthrobacter sp. AK04 TaxID=2900048 RepID=UPI001E448CDC|nr:hypothetical protein [Arthrobacter sp. AK04]MCD5341562.1 hypothetical protein [Arthrobacter sp. AK04]